MNSKTLLFVSRRLMFSSRNKGIAHVISLISLICIAIGSFALVVVLSVFNGFTSVAQDMLEKTCPPLLVESSSGRTINLSDIKTITDDKSFSYSAVIQQTAMITAGKEKMVVSVYGIDSSYLLFNALDSYMVNGKTSFDIRDSSFCIMGVNTASDIGLGKGAEKMNIPIKITVPSTDNNEQAMVLEDKLSNIEVLYRGAFQTHSDSDNGEIFIHVSQARKLLNLSSNQCHEIFIFPNNTSNVSSLQSKLQKQLGKNYIVKNILQQEPVYFRIVKSEKLAVYIILAFIIFIASSNIISAIIILKIQKEQMNKIFLAMGMRLKDLKKVYFSYGMSVNFLGCMLGIIAGICACLFQQRFGIIKLAKDAFVVDAFPVKIITLDIISIIIVVMLIGGICIRYGVSRIKS